MKTMCKTLLALVLCLALVLPCALAEEAYTPGETVRALFAKAWSEGQMITADLSLQFEVNAEALGLSEDELADVRAGDGVTVALEDGAECAGTVEKILYAPDEDGGYVACLRLADAPERLRIGQSVSVRY